LTGETAESCKKNPIKYFFAKKISQLQLCSLAAVCYNKSLTMKSLSTKVALIITGLLSSLFSIAQDVNHTLPPGYDPDHNKIIPDKVFEIGLPLLVLFMIANTISSIFKTRAENKLKEKALTGQLSEPTLVALFAEDKHLHKYVYLKWFLVLAAIGLSLVLIYFLFQLTGVRSGYLALGIISLFMSIAFLIYYRIIQNK
jgi:hypothetical protein